MRFIPTISFAVTLGLALPLALTAQTPSPGDKTTKPAPTPEQQKASMDRVAERVRTENLLPYKVFYLQAGSGPNYGNEILTGLRLMLDPSTKVYLIPELNAIVVRSTPEILTTAQQLVYDLDRPKQNYRVTYTIVESDNGKRIGVQHFVMAMIPGARTTLKDGSKVPVATGSYSAGAAQAGVQTQFTYLDVGLNFDATLNQGADGLRLDSKVEQSGMGEEKTIAGVTEPVIRQAVLVGSTTMQVGKPVMLGTLDVAASTRHLEVEALLELIK